MKTSIKHIKIILGILFICFTLSSFSQIQTDMMKYWYYRNRLQYFVVPGLKQGESQIICIRNKINAGNDGTDASNGYPAKNADYGQHGKYTGMYIGVLATEYYLLNRNGQNSDAAITYTELYFALNAVKEFWDTKAENYWPNYQTTNPDYNADFADPFNGFFIRGSVPCDFYSQDTFRPHGFSYSGESHVKLLNKDLTPEDTWDGVAMQFGNSTTGYLPEGHPGYTDHRTCDYCEGKTEKSGIPLHTDEDAEHVQDHPHYDANSTFKHPESMSQDEAIWILLGCEITIKLCPNGSAAQIATDMKYRIADYLINVHHIFGLEPNRLYEPCGYALKSWEGGSTYAFGRPLAVLDDNLQFSDIGQWISWAVQSVISISDYDLVAVLAAMTGSWASTSTGIINATAVFDAETFYLLLWEVLQNRRLSIPKQQLLLTDALLKLESAPCEGPYCYRSDYDGDGNWQYGGNYAGGGWASTYRWCKYVVDQQHGDEGNRGNYNGLDYMFLYNLFHIISNDNCPNYVNYVDRDIDIYLPIKHHSVNLDPYLTEWGTNHHPAKFAALDILTSTSTIGLQTEPEISNDPGNVTYVAGTSIHLKPGFHAMEGCYFHAYISELHCTEYLQLNGGKAAESYSDFYTPYYDSIISQPKTPYELNPEDTGSNTLTLECPIDTIKFKGINGDTIDDLHTYFWDFGNGITSTEVDPQVYYEPGTYNFSLALTDTNGVTGSINVLVIVPDCGTQTGLEEQTSSSSSSTSNGGFTVVPNPNNGRMTLVSKNIINYGSSFMIYDITGRVVYKKQLSEKQVRIQINTEDLENGVYLYAVISEQGKLLAKDKLVIINQ